MGREHHYFVAVRWTGNTGTGTSGYRDYGRGHQISADGKPTIGASSHAAFRGDRARWNPEELLIAALSSCHQLAYLHLCAVAGIVVVEYEDHAEGWMAETQDGANQFTHVLLHPRVTVATGADKTRALQLHHEAHAKCFIARSVKFPVEHEAEILSS